VTELGALRTTKTQRNLFSSSRQPKAMIDLEQQQTVDGYIITMVK